MLTKIREAENVTNPVDSVHPISEEEESYSKSMTGSFNSLSDLKQSKLLGIIWDSHTDKLLFDFSDVIEYASSLSPTKRSVLKVTAKLFDPLGLLSPFIIRLKVMF